MTFEQWQATRKFAEDLGSAVQMDLNGASGFYYANGENGEHIEARGFGFGVIIANTEEEFTTLEAAEQYLWDEFARDEIYTD